MSLSNFIFLSIGLMFYNNIILFIAVLIHLKNENKKHRQSHFTTSNKSWTSDNPVYVSDVFNGMSDYASIVVFGIIPLFSIMIGAGLTIFAICSVFYHLFKNYIYENIKNIKL